MLDTLAIRNFQVHSKLEIEFSPRITTFVGATDSGKSAIFRALYWLTFNKPSGTAFMKTGTKRTRVRVEYGDHVLIRDRSNKGNLYVLNGKTFEAFGKGDVPKEIIESLNLSELNFQGQHDSPFWFSETAGEVGRRLNQIVNLEIMDRTLSNLNQSIRKTSAELEVSSDRLKQMQEEKEKLSFIKDAEKSFEALSALDKDLAKKADSHTRLHNLLSRVIEQSHKTKQAEFAHSAGAAVVQLGESWYQSKRQRINLEGLVNSTEKAEARAGQTLPDLSVLNESALKYQAIRNTVKNLKASIAELEKLEEEERWTNQEAKSLADLLQKQIGETCPLCGTKRKLLPSS